MASRTNDSETDEIKATLRKLEQDLGQLYSQSKGALEQRQQAQRLKLHKEALNIFSKAYEGYKNYVESLEKKAKK
jgi:t-SNARE complex subunit (syntaxin)